MLAAGTSKGARSWPNNSLSSKVAGMAAILTATKGRPARDPAAWMARAANSLPQWTQVFL